jgi:hypothetical protein
VYQILKLDPLYHITLLFQPIISDEEEVNVELNQQVDEQLTTNNNFDIALAESLESE